MGKAQKARVSLDYDIAAKNSEKQWVQIVPGYAILEVKTNEQMFFILRCLINLWFNYLVVLIAQQVKDND